MRQVLLDIITAMTGIAVAGLLLHNPAAVEGESSGFFKGYSGALNTAGSTR